MAVVKRISPGSAFKVGGVLYAFLGLILGFFFASMMGVASMNDQLPAVLRVGAGIGAILIFPILYGILGAIMLSLGALVYNLASEWVGGLEVDIE